jgi:hypothetical protein
MTRWPKKSEESPSSPVQEAGPVEVVRESKERDATVGELRDTATKSFFARIGTENVKCIVPSNTVPPAKGDKVRVRLATDANGKIVKAYLLR